MRRLRLMLVCSSGGHLAQLYNLSPWWTKHERTWVTFMGADSLSLLAGERVHWAYQPTTRNISNAVRNFRLGISLVRRYRPDLVVSTGAGVAVSFFAAAKLWGARTAYIEVYDRVDLPTVTGRLCYPLSDLFVLQWEEQRRMYPKGKVVGALV
jgi:UDP-N-acetylglucosamine:LPS N-acetylglucosamine transferase